MNKEVLRSQIIEQYRILTVDKYQYERLKERYDLPAFITEPRVQEIKKYFLDYVYPNTDTRHALDAAFESLDGHIKAPGKLVMILMDATSVLFKYGRHLPQIFKAGLKALQSFRQASAFESMLVDAAMASKEESIEDTDELKQLIAKLPDIEVKAFIQGNDALFDALMDHKLTKKTIDIMHTLIKRMTKRTNVYSKEDIAGVEIGRDILEGGVALVSEMSDAEGRQLLELIKRVETESINEIFEKYK
ncbi:MAG: hypothetical protein ACJA01_001957 [Saprospiraceae bacterium]|jgi:hypothetical protein